MCDEIETTQYVLKKGTILYSGNSGSRKIQGLSDIFGYIGQRGAIKISGEFVLYASSNFDTAKGYALSCLGNSGFIHSFKVTRDVVLWEQPLFEEAEDVAKCVCSPSIRGIVVRYSKHHDEYALCGAEDYLEYIGTRKCSGSGEMTDEYHIVDKIKAYDLTFDTIPH
jgi:hypothetical protein